MKNVLTALLCAILVGCASAPQKPHVLADIKISALPATTGVAGADLFADVHSGVTSVVSAAQVGAYTNSLLGSSNLVSWLPTLVPGDCLSNNGSTLNWLGCGSMTSVGLALPSIFTVSGSPVTSAGTLTGSLASQAATTFFGGPTSGAAAVPTFRVLAATDIPSTLNGTLTIAAPGSGNDLIANGGIVSQGVGAFPGISASAAFLFTQQTSPGDAALGLIDSSNATDQKLWFLANSGNVLGLLATNDADTASRAAFTAARSGIAITGFTIGNLTDLPSITLDGPVSASGNISAGAAIAGASVAATGAVTGASVAATGAVSAASVAATGAVSGATVSATGATSGNTLVSTTTVTANGGIDLTPDVGTGTVQATSGMTTTPSVTATFRRVGKMAMLELPAITGTGNTVNTLTFTVAFPSGFAPTTSRSSSVSLANAGGGVIGQLLLSSTGFTVVISPVVGTNFTGSCGFNVPIIIPYSID